MQIRKLIARIVAAYGLMNANQASVHGTYEKEVPKSIKKQSAK